MAILILSDFTPGAICNNCLKLIFRKTQLRVQYLVKNQHCTLAQASSPLIDWPCLKFQQGQLIVSVQTLIHYWGGLNIPEGDQIFKALSEIFRGVARKKERGFPK